MGTSKYKGIENSTNEVGRRNSLLERSREKLMNAIIEYKKILESTTLLANLTQPEKKKMSELLNQINNLTLEVDMHSVGEGNRVIGSTAINTMVLLKDEINQLKYHNFYLTKRVEELEKSLSKGDDESDES